MRHTERAWLTLLLFVGITAVFALTATWHGVTSVDVFSEDVLAWQIAHHGALTVPPDFASPLALHFVVEHGHLVIARFPGAALLAVPAYWLFHQPFSVAPGTLTAVLATGAAGTSLFLALKSIVGEWTAAVAALVFAFATPTWSVSADGLWTHGPDQLTLALALVALARQRWALAGIALGAGVVMRPHLGLVAAVVLLWLVSRRAWSAALNLLPGVVGGTAVYLIYNRLLYGRWTIFGIYHPSGGLDAGPHAFLGNIAGALMSPQRGLLTNTPLLLALIPGLPAAWRAAPEWVRVAASGGGAYMLVQLYLSRFSGGGAFYSYRISLELVTLGAPLLVLCWKHWTSLRSERRAVFLALLGVSIFVQTAGALLPTPTYLINPWSGSDVQQLWTSPLITLIAVATAVSSVMAITILVRRQTSPSSRQAHLMPAASRPLDVGQG